MGYYTNYHLNVCPSTMMDAEEKRLLDSLKDCGASFEGDIEYGGEAYEKWNDHDEDMIRISKDLPRFIFELYGSGEFEDDHWVSYYKNGICETCRGRIVYEECSLSREMNELVKAEIVNKCTNFP